MNIKIAIKKLFLDQVMDWEHPCKAFGSFFGPPQKPAKLLYPILPDHNRRRITIVVEAV